MSDEADHERDYEAGGRFDRLNGVVALGLPVTLLLGLALGLVGSEVYGPLLGDRLPGPVMAVLWVGSMLIPTGTLFLLLHWYDRGPGGPDDS